MRAILIKEICNEMPNSSALDALNTAMGRGGGFKGEANHNKLGNVSIESIDADSGLVKFIDSKGRTRFGTQSNFKDNLPKSYKKNVEYARPKNEKKYVGDY